MPDDTISILDHLTALMEAHIKSVAERFEDRDVRYQQRFDAQTLAINAALQAAKEAVTKAEIATERRFESVNEFRKTLADQTASFVTRLEFDTLRDSGTERIRELAARLDKAEGRSQGGANLWAIIIGVIVVLVMAVGIFINARG